MHCPGPARGVVLWLGFCDRLEALPSATRRQNASEPGANLAPRLDRREQDLPWAHPHFSISVANGQRHHVFVERGVVCSRVVSDASRRRVLRRAIAARPVAGRHSGGDAGRRASVIGPPSEAKSGGGNRAGGIASDSVSNSEPSQADEALPREGQRPGSACDDFARRPCDRPGCYELFPIADEQSCKRFCSLACRLALRRVLDREARYRSRRRRWRSERVTERVRPPDTS